MKIFSCALLSERFSGMSPSGTELWVGGTEDEMEKALGAFIDTGRGAQSSAKHLTLLLEGTEARKCSTRPAIPNGPLEGRAMTITPDASRF